MRKALLLQLLATSLVFCQASYSMANEQTQQVSKTSSKDTKKNKLETKEEPKLQGLITQPKIDVEIREKMVADKELELAKREKKLNDDSALLENTRKQLVQEALNVKSALNTREKEITQKAVAAKSKKAKKYPDATKKFSDLLNSVSKENPVSD